MSIYEFIYAKESSGGITDTETIQAPKCRFNGGPISQFGSHVPVGLEF